MHQTYITAKLRLAFRAFDESAAPQGLYAISEYRSAAHPDPIYLADWQLILLPTIERAEYSALKIRKGSVKEGRFYCIGPDCLGLNIELVRISKIKVRRYGDTYRIDPHRDFAARWEQLSFPTRIRSLARPTSEYGRVLFLIGFAKESRGFDRELAQLREKLGATEQSADFHKDQWLDPHGRGFQTLCASWYWPPNH